MKTYKINGTIELTTDMSLDKMAKNISKKVIEISNDNIINWMNVYSIYEVKK